MYDHTYSTDGRVYSVNMMFLYINENKPKEVQLLVEDLKYQLEFACWGSEDDNGYTPLSVLEDPISRPSEYKRIVGVDLSYPIIVSGGFIIDGMHRLAKSVLQNNKYIAAYIFDAELLDTFIIDQAI